MTPAAYQAAAPSLTAVTDEQLYQIKQVFSPELLPKPTQE